MAFPVSNRRRRRGSLGSTATAKSSTEGFGHRLPLIDKPCHRIPGRHARNLLAGIQEGRGWIPAPRLRGGRL